MRISLNYEGALAMPVRFCLLTALATLIVGVPTFCRADEAPSSTRYGAFGLLDRRSIYGKYWFPEPLATDESDVDNEVRADWFHGEKRNHQFDSVQIEIEKSFGLMTVEIAGGYESDRTRSFDPDTSTFQREREEGFSNIELGVRHPVFQYVS